MLHHISFGVKNLRQAANFYDAVLHPLGYVRVWTDFEGSEETHAIGYGELGGGDKLAFKQRPHDFVAPGSGFHLAFSAPTREAVDRFYAEAICNGGQDNGAPGLRPDYGPNYYAAFIVDPEGLRIEAVINTAA